MVIEVLRCGGAGALVELADHEQVVGLHATLRANPPEGVLELVPAACTLLIRYDPKRTSVTRLTEAVGELQPRVGADHARDEVRVPIRYEGPDLAAVAAGSEMSSEEVVRRHKAATYIVAFCGFAPGFAYLTGLDRKLHLPRRTSPRTSVPAGSVALADEYTGIYPRSSPGGWHLIGATKLAVWDLQRKRPSLLTPGTTVRFFEIRQ
jgi:KipI family sensor histidine kinase inhibitor